MNFGATPFVNRYSIAAEPIIRLPRWLQVWPGRKPRATALPPCLHADFGLPPADAPGPSATWRPVL